MKNFRTPRMVFRTPHTVFRTPRMVLRTPRTVFRTPHMVFRTVYTVFRTAHTVFRTVHTEFRTPHTVFRTPRRDVFTKLATGPAPLIFPDAVPASAPSQAADRMERAGASLPRSFFVRHTISFSF